MCDHFVHQSQAASLTKKNGTVLLMMVKEKVMKASAAAAAAAAAHQASWYFSHVKMSRRHAEHFENAMSCDGDRSEPHEYDYF